MSSQIFISYHNSKRGAEVAELFYTMLGDAGYRVYLDKKRNRSSGKWEEVQNREMDTARDVLLIVTAHDLESMLLPDSHWLREVRRILRLREQSESGERERPVNIIPVCADGAIRDFYVLPGLPPEIRSIAEENALTLNESFSGILEAYQDLREHKLTCTPEYFMRRYFQSGSIGYTSTRAGETERLHKQMKFSEALDRDLFQKARRMLGKKNGLTALDIGCTDGYVTTRRLNGSSGFSRVIGIDRDDSFFLQAREYADEENRRNPCCFSFEKYDVEEDGFPAFLTSLKGDLPGFDVIYLAFTLHHLQDPVRLLKTLNRFLSPQGVIILRGIDDGAQLLHVYDPKTGDPDKEKCALIEKMVKRTMDTDGISNRIHGRQFYSWLRQAGFQRIESSYAVSDTVGKDREYRMDFFPYNFSFRTDYPERWIRRIQSGIGDKHSLHRAKKIQQDLAVMVAQMDDLLKNDDNLYYMIVEFGMIAQRFDDPSGRLTPDGK